MECIDPTYLNLYKKELMFEKVALNEMLTRIIDLPNLMTEIDKINRADRYGIPKEKCTVGHIRSILYTQDKINNITNTIDSLDIELNRINKILSDVNG